MKSEIRLRSEQLNKEDIKSLLHAIRLCERANFPDKEIVIGVDLPDLSVDEMNEILTSIKPPFKYGPYIFNMKR